MAHMKKVSASQLLSIDSCKVKGYFEQLNLNYTKGKSYFISVALKELLKEIDFTSFDVSDIQTKLDALLEDRLFFSKQTKKEELSLLTQQLVRYFEYEKSLGRKILQRGVVEEVEVQDFTITVTADFIFENEDSIEVVKIKKSEPKLSYKGRKFETRPSNSIELYLLFLLGNKLYKGKKIVASLYHLKSKDDTRKRLIPEFEINKGKNIISHSFDPQQAEAIEKRIVELLSMNLSIDSEKTCDTSLCEHCSFASICHYEETKEVLEEVKEIKKAGDLKLTDSQYEAIFFRKGIARINAGAGSGKTTVIALRVAELLQEGVHPKDILLITYTNKGAQEMREKIAYWLKEMDIQVNLQQMDILTFHAWGDKVLKNEYALLGFTKAPSLAEKVQKYDIIFELLDENEKLEGFDYQNPLLDFPNAKGVVVQLAEYFDAIKGAYINDAETCSEKLNLVPSLAEKIFYLYQQYNQKLKQRNLVEYPDLLHLLLDLAENHPEVYEKYAYKHIMIDEFQDTDNIQFDIISALIDQDKFESLMVVGDDSQSIYSFRHTSQENILNFHQYFFEVKDIYFVENFRSTPQIIEVANCLNDLNQNKIHKTLVSQTSDGTKPKLCRYSTLEEEYKGIASIVEEKIKNGVSPENIAIIARTRSELINIEPYLKERNIPTVFDVSEPILKNKNVQVMISLTNFFEDNSLDYTLLEYLYIFKKEEMKRMNPEQIKQLVEQFKSYLISQYTILENEKEKINFYFDTIQKIAEKDAVVASFLEELKNKDFENTYELFSYLKKLLLYKDEKTIMKKDVRYKAVVLTTAHSSKGKEFDIVINTIDHYKYDSSMKPEKIEEERRLLFVSITRAKKELYITYQTNQDRIKIRGTYCKFADELKGVEHFQFDGESKELQLIS
jgi:superfamily I DNA/RNA helicase